MEDGTGRVVKALLYRGTPDGPAFWRRALLDAPLAAGELYYFYSHGMKGRSLV